MDDPKNKSLQEEEIAAAAKAVEESEASSQESKSSKSKKTGAKGAKTQEEPGEGYTLSDEDGKIIPDYDLNMKDFDNGDIVEGEVVKVYRDEVLVDIDYKSEGVIPVEELSIRKNIDPTEVVSEGDHIAALVLEKEDMDGRLILSKKRADFEKSWDRIEEIAEDEGTVTGRVIEAVKGGLILDIGLRGFLPASLVEMSRVKDLRSYIGQELECRVIETNRYRNNVVLSRRALLQEAEKEKRTEILSKLEKGQVLKGTVSNLANFGAFVDLGGIDGLIHISELSWHRIGHPSEAVDVGEEVEVQVLDVDVERGRVSLGYKQTQEDPWKKAITNYEVSQVLEGEVVRTVPFGAFVAIEPNVEGLVHISEISKERVEDAASVLSAGDKIQVKIIDINIEKRRLSLSMRRALEDEEEPKAEEGGAAQEAGAAGSEAAKTAKTEEEEPTKAEAGDDEAGEGEAKEDEESAKEKPVLKLKEKKEDEEAEPGSLEAIVADIKKTRSDDDKDE